MRVGVVAEGPSDFYAIEAVVQHVDASVELELIQPETTLQSGYPNGWRGVRAWCQENGFRLETIMGGVRGRELDALVVQVDCSMAHNVGARRPCPPAKATADALRHEVLGWLGRAPLPGWIVLATPAQMTETWIVAALSPPYGSVGPIECDLGVEMELVRRHYLRRRCGEVKKPAGRYLPLVNKMIGRWDVVKRACGEASRFDEEARRTLAAVAAGGGHGP